jgi:LysM repeat protein
MIQISSPDAEGKVVHTVQSYQTLTTISQAYGITVDAILNMNGIQADWPLQIGQILLVSPGTITPSATPRPLSPIEKLTPASDGKYYHTVQSGETISWIAGLYEVNMYDLMAWNGLDESSILQPEQKLILNVTPPATATFTAGPPTLTPTATREAPTPSFTPSSQNPTGAEIMPTAAAASTPVSGSLQVIRYASIGLAAVVLGIVVFFMRRKK